MFLPVTREEAGGQPDIVYVIGEAYVDHPSFGHAIISRIVQAEGLKIAILPQPQNDADYTRFGAPAMGFFVSGGVVDSMVNNYTGAKIRRTRDVYSEGGAAGLRPDRCVDVYCRNLKRLYPDVPVMIGGIEASLRRFAHYDYWADRVLPSILISSGADLLVYGMGERPVREICRALKRGIPLDKLHDIRGTAYVSEYEGLSKKLREEMAQGGVAFCPSFEEVSANKLAYVKAFNEQAKNNDPFVGKPLVQRHGKAYVVQNAMQFPLSPEELDKVYSLPYERTYHPMYKKGVPAIEEVKFSLTSVRGCFGNCNYCAITYHQGRIVQKRSKDSIVEEANKIIADRQFKGYIHDVGGPTANFRDPACHKQTTKGVCTTRNCIGWEKCPSLEVSHEEYIDLLRTLRRLEGVRKVFIRSGIRFDYLMYDKSDEFLKELCEHHISGQLKVAPEHVSDRVLKRMNKPPFSMYLAFKRRFDELNEKLHKKQYLVPYLISSHPGCTLKDAVNLALYLKSINYMPEQVQDFYPTPSTKSTCMYYTGIDPDTMQPVYVPRDKQEKRMQRALMQYAKPSNYAVVREALILAGRRDLIGSGAGCLVPAERGIDSTNFKVQRGSQSSRSKDGRQGSSDKKGTGKGAKNHSKIR